MSHPVSLSLSLFLFLLLLLLLGLSQLADRKPEMRILAIRASLTTGFYNYGLSHHPYSLRLLQLISSLGIAVTIDQKGISGERVVPSMVRRLESLLAEQNSSYDWVMILGGTNDLGYGQPAEQIFNEGIKLMYDMVLRRDSDVQLVVMTVIENGFYSPAHRHDRPRQELNELIRNYASNLRVHLVDLAKEIRFHHVDDLEQRDAIWDDGVHFKAAGYALMANVIFQAIHPHLALQKNIEN